MSHSWRGGERTPTRSCERRLRPSRVRSHTRLEINEVILARVGSTHPSVATSAAPGGCLRELERHAEMKWWQGQEDTGAGLRAGLVMPTLPSGGSRMNESPTGATSERRVSPDLVLAVLGHTGSSSCTREPAHRPLPDGPTLRAPSTSCGWAASWPQRSWSAMGCP